MAKGDNRDLRAYNAALGFLCSLGVLAIEIGYLFWKQWVVFEAVLKENPVFFMLLFGSQFSLPLMFGNLAGARFAKRTGDEAEQIARSLRP